MNQNKVKKLLRNQSSLAITVYDAVPVTEAWTRAMVAGELDRGGHTASMKAIEGCLYSLVDDGLVKEPKKGYFIRQRVSVPVERPVLHVAKAAPSQQPFQLTEEDEPMADPVEKFDQLRKTLTGIAVSLTETLSAIDRAAEMADDIALRCMEQQESNTEELEKLRTLAAAIKGLS